MTHESRQEKLRRGTSAFAFAMTIAAAACAVGTFVADLSGLYEATGLLALATALALVGLVSSLLAGRLLQ